MAVWDCPELSVQPMLTLSPGWYWLMAFVRSLAELIVVPPSEVMTSPSARPASWAGPFVTVLATEAPDAVEPVLPVLPELPPKKPPKPPPRHAATVAGAAALGVDLDAEEGRLTDVDRGRARTGLDRLRDGERGVDRDGEALGPRGLAVVLERGPGRGRGVHPEHVARGVDQRAARVSGLNVGVGLDEAAQLLRRAVTVVTGGDRLVQRSHGPARCAGGPAGAAGVADADNVLADGHVRRVAEGRGLQARGVVQLQDRDVLRPVVSDDAGGVGLVVADVGHADARRAVDHVVVGQDHAVGREHDARAGGLLLLVAERRVDVDQARVDLGRDGVDVTRARGAR